MTIIGYIMIIAVAFAAVCAVLAYRNHTRRILRNLNHMLESAMQGDFTEKCFDESMLSAVETKFAQYLAASTVSSRNLKAEKDAVKSLISDISHQTKTPLSNILLYTQLLKEQKLNEESRTYVEEMNQQTEKLQMLMEALVKTSRLEAGVISMHPSCGKLEAVVRSAVAQLLPKAEEKSICITVENADTEAVFDRKWTEEALVNLLDNAIKYAPDGGFIRVNVVEYQLFAEINVWDNGSGICEEEQPKIFQRFYRGLEHQEKDGIGIGLYLVRQIAEGQGGYVRVQSAKGQGTTFSMYIPRH